MALGIDGATVLLLVDDGSSNFVSVGAQTGLSTEESNSLIESSSKDHKHTRWLYGKHDSTATLNSLYVPNDTAFGYLKTAYTDENKIVVRRSEDGTEIEEATALVSSISKDYPDNDVSSVTVELQLDTEFTSVP